jgi:hypothetical protein
MLLEYISPEYLICVMFFSLLFFITQLRLDSHLETSTGSPFFGFFLVVLSSVWFGFLWPIVVLIISVGMLFNLCFICYKHRNVNLKSNLYSNSKAYKKIVIEPKLYSDSEGFIHFDRDQYYKDIQGG